ncbi:hypothetical protein E1176_00275, partial [Fulvivirga sp. RKSG066]|uniref:outer membrane beta-barrel protein n=1 Tax=Fulvivirga aurantia TaxID=2529383 RepID=UPI0012BBBD76|nr:hypothetical protein [Fulvivirga aurantia]
GGFTTAFKVRNRFFLQADFTYTRKGKKVEGKEDPALENRAVYHYFNVPIIYRIDFKSQFQGSEFKWFLGVGPNVNYWWKGNGTLKSSELDENDIGKLEYKVDFDFDPELPDFEKQYIEAPNRVQLGVIFASGLVFEPVPKQTIIVEARFEWGHSYLGEGKGIFADILAYEDDFRARNFG